MAQAAGALRLGVPFRRMQGYPIVRKFSVLHKCVLFVFAKVPWSFSLLLPKKTFHPWAQSTGTPGEGMRMGGGTRD